MVRGGGTMCLMDTQLWNVFNATVGDIWPCETAAEMPLEKNAIGEN